jgi:NADPH-dependent 2,4-dienoyl-CoA reductase/sulfur reductase-like enzyme
LTASPPRDRIAIVGASLAGLRAAEALRAQGYGGDIVAFGAEPHLPYDRPPLSKQVLAGTQEPAAADLPVADDLGVEWRLGQPVAALDVSARRLTMATGEPLDVDGVVIATGATPRLIPSWPELGGIHALRTIDDCLALRADLLASPSRVVVVGAGFIGAEVAATARGLGLEVTIVEPLAAPVVRGLGAEMGGIVAAVHRDHGVDLRLGVGVEAVTGGADGRVAAVSLGDGTSLDADVVLVGIGVVPAVGWLDGSGLEMADGVVCDETCLAAPGVVAAGDVARWPHPLHGSVRIEHWDNAQEQGAHAARTLLADLDGRPGEPFAPVPWFWSDQYDRKLQVAGRAPDHPRVRVVGGSVDDRKFVALYGADDDEGPVTAVLGMNSPAAVMRWRSRIVAGLTWPDALAAG